MIYEYFLPPDGDHDDDDDDDDDDDEDNHLKERRNIWRFAAPFSGVGQVSTTGGNCVGALGGIDENIRKSNNYDNVKYDHMGEKPDKLTGRLLSGLPGSPPASSPS